MPDYRYKLLVLAVFVFPSCSHAQPNKLDRPTALRVLLQPRGFTAELTTEAKTVAEWVESWWGTGRQLETNKLRAQAELDFLNRMVDAGVLKKLPDQLLDCTPEPDCKEHAKFYNFAGIVSPQVKITFPGQRMNGRSIEFATLVLGKAANVKVTGIMQEGIDAMVDIEFGYAPTDLYKRITPSLQDVLGKCSLPELATNPPSFCGRWPNAIDIAAKKDTASIHLKRYDDGWRLATN